jgi:GT2 family glycosyltransferase
MTSEPAEATGPGAPAAGPWPSGPPAALPFVSVIIPVYNDGERLARCLAALEVEDYPGDRYEVIVVDNGSRRPLQPAAARFTHARFESEPRPGIGRARVKGIALARGQVLAFTDADCVPAPDWISQGVARLLGTPGCGLVGGRIDVFARDPARPNLAESLSTAMHLKQERFLREGQWAVLANAFVPRRVVDAVGAMNPEVISSGEVEWGRRILAAGYRQVYAPEAIVRHPARGSIRELCQRAVRLEYGWHQLRTLSGLGLGMRHWLGQYLAGPLRATYRDVIRNPHLTPARRAQVAGLSCLLIQVRILAYVLVRAGVNIDVREHWG